MTTKDKQDLIERLPELSTDDLVKLNLDLKLTLRNSRSPLLLKCYQEINSLLHKRKIERQL